MYELEVDQLVSLRSHDKTPTEGVVESAIKQVEGWFRKVYPGLAWENEETPENIIQWESGEAYVRHNIIDPKLTAWSKRTRREIMKGSPLPTLEAMKPGDLEAVSSRMLATMQRDFRRWGEVYDKRNAFVEKYGLRRCTFGVEERHCEHQTSYSMVETLPTSTDDVVFVCDVEKCMKEEKSNES